MDDEEHLCQVPDIIIEPFSNIKVLKLHRMEIAAYMFEHFLNLQTLHIIHCNITGDFINKSQSRHNKSQLKYLRVLPEFNDLTSVQTLWGVISLMLNNKKTLETIDIQTSDWETDSIKSFFKYLKNISFTNVTTLKFNGSHVDVIPSFFKHFKFPKLTHLATVVKQHTVR